MIIKEIKIHPLSGSDPLDSVIGGWMSKTFSTVDASEGELSMISDDPERFVDGILLTTFG